MTTTDPVLLQHAFALLASGKAAESLQLAQHMQAQNPNESAWLTLKGLSFSALRDPEAAADIYRQLIALEPEVPEHQANLGNALLELAHPHAARLALLEARRLGGSDGNLYFSLARTALECGEPHLARDEVVMALKSGLDQDLEVALFYLKCLIALDEIDLAKDNAQRLMDAPLSADLACEYAFLLLQLSDYRAAEIASLKVPRNAPEYPLALMSLGLSFERSNQMSKVRAIRQELSQINPDFALDAVAGQHMASPAGQTLMQLDARLAARDKNFALVAALLQPLLALGKLEPNLRIALQFELARALDELGEREQTLALLASAHAERLRQVTAAHPKMVHEEDPLQLLDRAFPDFLRAAAAPDTFADPVFVVGFPRSGTTLLEQLLDAHSGLQSFDEQPFLQRCIAQMRAWGKVYPEQLNQLQDQQILELRQLYFGLCKSVCPSLAAGARYVDKNPLNLSRLPLIQALFPQAKIIVVLRHPADCVLSCYMQHFRAPAFAITMQTLAHTAQMYQRVFQFYTDAKPRLQLAIHELKYEDLVGATEATARALFGFLVLDWSDQLMAFTERAKTRAISTPSYAAVTESVNQRAVAKHRKYAPAFAAAGADQVLAPWVAYFAY
jgi:tetratricopeptide (TPR) repeat protein